MFQIRWIENEKVTVGMSKYATEEVAQKQKERFEKLQFTFRREYEVFDSEEQLVLSRSW